MRLIVRFSCKLNIERNGMRLLSPQLQAKLFNFIVNESEGTLQFTISPRDKSISLPSSPYMPGKFKFQNISKVSSQCIQQGRLSLSLENFNKNYENNKSLEKPCIMTVIYISEAYPDSLSTLMSTLQAGPSKRSAMEVFGEMMEKRSRPKVHLFNMLSDELIRIILEFWGEEKSKLRLINRNWGSILDPMVKRISVKNPKDAPGEVIVRVIKKHYNVCQLDLSNSKNLTSSLIRKAMSFPLRKVKVLSLRNCLNLDTNALFILIRDSTRLEVLDIVNCKGASDCIVKQLNRKTHLKHIKKLYIGAPMTNVGVSLLLEKYPNLSAIHYSNAILTPDICEKICLMKNLKQIEIEYSSLVPAGPCQVVEAPVSKLVILPEGLVGAISNAPLAFVTAFRNCDLEELGCPLDNAYLRELYTGWRNLKVLRVIELPVQLPSTVRTLFLLSDGYELLNYLRYVDDQRFQHLTCLKLVTHSDHYIQSISNIINQRLPLCKFEYFLQKMLV